jgi:hypothetical protein
MTTCDLLGIVAFVFSAALVYTVQALVKAGIV